MPFRIDDYPLLKRALLPFHRIYMGASWRFLGFVFRAYLFCRRRPEAQSVRSVLHVSCLSHKPFMLSRLMRQKGISSDYLAVAAESGWLKLGERGYDYNIPSDFPFMLRPWLVYYYLWRIINRYDVVHYHFASIITDDGHELEYFKKAGKVVVFHFRGCDLRQRSVNIRMNPGLNCCSECDYPAGSCENAVQLQRIALARKYADLLFVTTPDLRDFMPEAGHIPFVAPYGIDLAKIEPVQRDKRVFRVVTSSNHNGVDGTGYVRDAVRRLRDEGRAVELVEVFKTPYERALAIYKSADVYVGKLRMGYYNNANIECMAMGVPCMSYIRDEYLKDISDCPVIVTRPETVYERLREYMDNPGALMDAGRRGPGFVKKHHDPGMIADMIIKRYNGVLARRREEEGRALAGPPSGKRWDCRTSRV